MALTTSASVDRASAAARQSPMRRVIMEILVTGLIAAAIGTFRATTQTKAPQVRDGARKSEGVPTEFDRLTLNVIDLPPIVTNLSSPTDVWIRLEASIVFDIKTLPHPEIAAAEIAGDILAYLRTMTLAQIEGPIGLQNIRRDTNERASIRSAGKVTELIVRTLVVQ